MNSIFKHQDDMLKAEECQRKSIQRLSEGEYDNEAGVLNEDDSGDTVVSTFELYDGEYLDAANEDGKDHDKFGRFVTTLHFNNSFLNKVEERKTDGEDSDGQHNTDSGAVESDGGYTDWSNNLSEGELLNTGYSDAEESNAGYTDRSNNLSEGELLNTGYSGAVESDGGYTDWSNNLSEGELITARYSDAEESDGGYTDWCNNLSEGELITAGYSDTESDSGLSEGEVLTVGPIVAYKGEREEADVEDCYYNISEGEVCDDEILNDEDSTSVFEDNISDGEIPNEISKRYFSDGELYSTCENEFKNFLNTAEEGRRYRDEYAEVKTIKYIENLYLVDEMFDKITKVNRWLFPEVGDINQQVDYSSRYVSDPSPDNSATNCSGDECNNSILNRLLEESNGLTDLTEVSLASSSNVKMRKKRNLFIRFCNFVSKRLKRN